MCLGGGSQSYPEPKYLKREDPPWGRLEDPPDMVNDMLISDTGDFTRKNNLKIDKPDAKITKQYCGAA